MTARLVRNSAILAELETTYGTDPSPSGASNAMLISNLSVSPLITDNMKREVVRPYLGNQDEVVGTKHVELSFDIELQASGVAGTAPAWGCLLLACGFDETITASTRVDYTPVSSSIESVTIYYHDDGVLHKAHGCRGDVEIGLNVNEKPVLKFKFVGLYGGITAAANPSLTLTAFKAPLGVTNANTGDVTLGCTYSAGALSGGTSYPSKGLSIKLGNAVNHVPLLGEETVELSDRNVTGSVQFNLTAAQEVSLVADVENATIQSIGLLHGTTAGYKVLVHAPAVQLTNISKQEINGKRLIGFDLIISPLAGNDDLRIVLL